MPVPLHGARLLFVVLGGSQRCLLLQTVTCARWTQILERAQALNPFAPKRRPAQRMTAQLRSRGPGVGFLGGFRRQDSACRVQVSRGTPYVLGCTRRGHHGVVPVPECLDLLRQNPKWRRGSLRGLDRWVALPLKCVNGFKGSDAST
jgi:hypothetical protein